MRSDFGFDDTKREIILSFSNTRKQLRGQSGSEFVGSKQSLIGSYISDGLSHWSQFTLGYGFSSPYHGTSHLPEISSGYTFWFFET